MIGDLSIGTWLLKIEGMSLELNLVVDFASDLVVLNFFKVHHQEIIQFGIYGRRKNFSIFLITVLKSLHTLYQWNKNIMK